MAGQGERRAGLPSGQGGPLGGQTLKGRNPNTIINRIHQWLFGSKQKEWDRIGSEDAVARERYNKEMAAKGYSNQGGRYYPTGQK